MKEKRVKYFNLAKAIKTFLYLGIFLMSLNIICSLIVDIFNTKSYTKFAGWTIGYTTKGNFVNARLSFNPADTTLFYKNGVSNIYIGEDESINPPKSNNVLDKVVSQFISHENGDIKISNNIFMSDNVKVRVFSKNKKHNIFWAITSQLNSLLIVLSSLVLVKLTKRYMDGEILMPRSFKLFSFLGLLLIIKEVFMFTIGIVNMLIMQHPNFYTTSMLTSIKYDLNISLDFTHTESLSNIGIGILIILLAQVLKQAILLKQEQDLTI